MLVLLAQRPAVPPGFDGEFSMVLRYDIATLFFFSSRTTTARASAGRSSARSFRRLPRRRICIHPISEKRLPGRGLGCLTTEWGLGPGQVKRNGKELDALPATVVGEFSASRPPGCTLPTTTFFSAQVSPPSSLKCGSNFCARSHSDGTLGPLQLKAYHKKSTHGMFFWCWKDGAGEDWGLKV